MSYLNSNDDDEEISEFNLINTINKSYDDSDNFRDINWTSMPITNKLNNFNSQSIKNQHPFEIERLNIQHNYERNYNILSKNSKSLINLNNP